MKYCGVLTCGAPRFYEEWGFDINGEFVVACFFAYSVVCLLSCVLSELFIFGYNS